VGETMAATPWPWKHHHGALRRRQCATKARTETPVPNCARDEGRSLGAGCQEQASNYHELRR
jgi:hypothetical protein